VLHFISETLVSWGPGSFLPRGSGSAGIPLPAVVDALLMGVAALKPGLAYWSQRSPRPARRPECMGLYYAARKGGVRYLDKHTQTGKGLKFRLWFLRYGLVTVFVPALLPIPPLPTKVFVDLRRRPGGKSTAVSCWLVLAARIPSTPDWLPWLAAWSARRKSLARRARLATHSSRSGAGGRLFC